MRTTPGLFQVLGGDLRPRPQLRVGIVWGVAPGDAGGANLQGPVSGHPIEIPRPPLTGCLRIGWLQAGIPEPYAPRSPCNVPAAGRQGSGTAPVTHACPKPQETCVRAPSVHPASPRTCSGVHPAAWPLLGRCRNKSGMTTATPARSVSSADNAESSRSARGSPGPSRLAHAPADAPLPDPPRR